MLRSILPGIIIFSVSIASIGFLVWTYISSTKPKLTVPNTVQVTPILTANTPLELPISPDTIGVQAINIVYSLKAKILEVKTNPDNSLELITDFADKDVKVTINSGTSVAIRQGGTKERPGSARMLKEGQQVQINIVYVRKRNLWLTNKVIILTNAPVVQPIQPNTSAPTAIPTPVISQ